MLSYVDVFQHYDRPSFAHGEMVNIIITIFSDLSESDPGPISINRNRIVVKTCQAKSQVSRVYMYLLPCKTYNVIKTPEKN